MSPTEKEIRVSSQDTDEKGRPVTYTTLSPSNDKVDRAIPVTSSAVIPVIFLPGIMGTNLRSARGKRLWRPPNLDGVIPYAAAIPPLVAYCFRGPATRQRRLDVRRVRVDERGPINAERTLKKKVARARGWGALNRSAYHPVMALMQKRLNNIKDDSKLMEWWNEIGQRAPADYGDENGGAALSDADFCHAARYRYEVWGGGYNWVQSNEDSGKDLIEHIEKVLAHHRSLGESVQKVILVTHSMGGLVARAIACIHDYENVLGVVHGVMPATGAPATYYNCRRGYLKTARYILGKNGKDVTAVLANAPGGLELLPSFDYGDGRAWLKLGGTDDNPSYTLPKSDPYEEIYHSREWYGLVPEQSAGLLDPARLNKKKKSEGYPIEPFDRFDESIAKAKKFQAKISRAYPSPAYVHYGADDRMHGLTDIHWEGPTFPNPIGLEMSYTDHTGIVRLTKREPGPASVDETDSIELILKDAHQPGDATVPTISGEAPNVTGVAASFRQGNQGKGKYVTLKGEGSSAEDAGYDHQGSYNDTRSQWATLFSIVKMTREADWSSS